MADISVLVDQEVSKDRDVIFGVTRSVASQNARSAGLQENPVHIADGGVATQQGITQLLGVVHVQDTVSSRLNPDPILIPAESLKVQDTVSVLENPLIAAPAVESLKVQDTVSTSENPLFAAPANEALKVQDTVLASGDALFAAPAVESVKVLDYVVLPDLYAVPKPEGIRFREVLYPFKPATGNLAIALLEQLKLGDGNTSQGPYGGTGFTGYDPSTTTASHLNWTNPHKAAFSDDDYATVLFDPAHDPAQSDWLKATGFGFSIPPGARITGFLVQVEHKADLPTNVGADIIQLILAGDRAGGVKLRGGFWDTAEIVDDYGGPDDRWYAFSGGFVDTGWTPANVNDPGFGAADRIGGDNNTLASIDSIRVTVYYRDPASLDVAVVDIFDELLHVQDAVTAAFQFSGIQTLVTETILLSDQPPFIEERLKIQDTVSAAIAGNDLSRAVGDENVKVADTVTVSENPLFAAPAVESLIVQDTVGVSENPLFAAPATENLKVQDTVLASTGGLLVIVPDELLHVQDTVTLRENPLFSAAPVESLKVQDTVTVSENPLFAATAVEVLHVDDSDLVTAIGMDEILHVVDQTPIASLIAAGDLSRAVTDETLKIADTVTVLENPLFSAAGVESLHVVDTVTVLENPLFAAPAVEALHVQDTVTVLENPLFAAPAQESLKVVDIIVASSGGLIAILADEVLHVQDTLTGLENPEYAAPALEPLKLAETVTVGLERSVSITSEALKVQDSVSAILDLFVVVVAENCRVQDSATTLLTTLRVVIVDEALHVHETLSLGVDILSVVVGPETLLLQDYILRPGIPDVIVRCVRDQVVVRSES